ncbi:hypothetical protein V8C86DRAFT_2439312 [Haematococcus lacustris]
MQPEWYQSMDAKAQMGLTPEHENVHKTSTNAYIDKQGLRTTPDPTCDLTHCAQRMLTPHAPLNNGGAEKSTRRIREAILTGGTHGRSKSRRICHLTRSIANISMPFSHTEAWEVGVLLAATPRQGMIPIEPPPVYSTVSVNLAATRYISFPAANPSHPEPDDIPSTLHSVSTTLFGVIPNSLLTTGLDSHIARRATFDITIAGHCLQVLD